MSMDLEEQYDKIYRYCYMKLRHRQAAEDVTQETFLRFLNTHEYREMGKQLAYLYTIARNLCIDSCRRAPFLPLTEEIPADGPEEEAVYSLALGEALKRLADKDREMIFLRYVNELPVGAIAKLFGLSRFAVYRRLQASLRQLKEDLG